MPARWSAIQRRLNRIEEPNALLELTERRLTRQSWRSAAEGITAIEGSLPQRSFERNEMMPGRFMMVKLRNLTGLRYFLFYICAIMALLLDEQANSVCQLEASTVPTRLLAYRCRAFKVPHGAPPGVTGRGVWPRYLPERLPDGECGHANLPRSDQPVGRYLVPCGQRPRHSFSNFGWDDSSCIWRVHPKRRHV